MKKYRTIKSVPSSHTYHEKKTVHERKLSEEELKNLESALVKQFQGLAREFSNMSGVDIVSEKEPLAYDVRFVS